VKRRMRAENTEECDISVLRLLHRAAQCVEDLFHVATNGLDVTPRQFVLLEQIANRKGLSQSDLVKCTGIDRSTMADLVQRLVKKRYVQRRRAKNDARVYRIALTPQGLAVLTGAKPIAAQVEKELLSVLPIHRARELLGSLSSIVQHSAHYKK
jgi:DNA-binding MarR family transcriptional regulator